jgi:hypothetical protein
MASLKHVYLVLVLENVKNSHPKIVSADSYLFESVAKARYEDLVKMHKRRDTVVIKKILPLIERMGIE